MGNRAERKLNAANKIIAYEQQIIDNLKSNTKKYGVRFAFVETDHFVNLLKARHPQESHLIQQASENLLEKMTDGMKEFINNIN